MNHSGLLRSPSTQIAGRSGYPQGNTSFFKSPIYQLCKVWGKELRESINMRKARHFICKF